MGSLAFQIQGNTVLVAASSSTSVAPTQISTGPGMTGAYLSNASSANLYVAIGSSLVAAGMPTTAIPCVGACFPPYWAMPITVPPSTALNWCSAVTSAGTAAPGLFATPGYGQ